MNNVFLINDVDSMVTGGNAEYIHELERHIEILETVYRFGETFNSDYEYLRELHEKIEKLKSEKVTTMPDLVIVKGE